MSQVKYPRTYHLPFSEGRSSDDKVLSTLDHFHGKEVVVTMKMDGENCSIYSTGFHARSLDSRSHPSRFWVARFWSTIASSIPDGWRICGENLYAQHSIPYSDLKSYFLGFSIWNSENQCLSWDDTLEWFELIGIIPVQELYRGVFDERVLRNLVSTLDLERDEGFVLRLASSFAYNEFSRSVAKWVRPAHVQSDKHWMHREVVPNRVESGVM
jgi:hypothetical protein